MSFINEIRVKMSVPRNTDKPLIKNILVDTYMRHTNRKLHLKKKPSFIEYLAYYSFIMVIIDHIICLNLSDPKLRLYLFDSTLFLGGIRQYNNFVIIITNFMAFCMFKLLYISPDKRLNVWIDIYEVIIGEDRLQHDSIICA